MLLKPDYSVGPSFSDADRWRVLNDAIQHLYRAQTPVQVLRIIAESLNRVGFHVVVGNLNLNKMACRVHRISLGDGSGQPRQPDYLKSMRNRVFPLAALTASTDMIARGEASFVSLDLQQAEAKLAKVLEAVLQVPSLADYRQLSGIVAPVYSSKKPLRQKHYLIFAIASQATIQDMSFVNTLAQFGASILDNMTLKKQTRMQRKNAETLREVSRIVSSNLNLDTVLTSILEELAKVIPYDSAAVHLESQGYLRLEAGSGFANDEPILDIAVPVDTNSLYQEMQQTKKPIVIRDVRTDPRYTFWAGTSPIRSWIGVPLILNNEVIGQISVDSFRKNAFEEVHGNLALALALHVATAIQNARFFERVNKTADELRALLDVARDVSSSLDPERVMYLMASRVKALMQASVIVYLLNGISDELNPVILLEAQIDQISDRIIKHGETVARQAMRVKSSVIINEPVPLSPANSDEANLPETLMATPFVVQDRAIGAIVLSREAEPFFTQADGDLITRFALQTGVAIDNTRLYKQLERRLNRENLINRLSRRMSSKLGLTDLASDIMMAAKEIARAEIAALILKDPANQDMYLRYTHDGNGMRMTQNSVRPGIAAHAMTRKQVVLSNDYAEEIFAIPAWIDQAAKGAIAIPILMGDRVLGALGLFTSDKPFINSSEILTILEYIGRQGAVAIENALLFQQVNEYAHHLEDKVQERTSEIRQQKEQTDAILEGAADAILIISADGSIEYVNPAFTNLTGYKASNTIGQSFEFMMSIPSLTPKYQQLLNTVRSGKTWRGDIRSKRQDDSEYDADLTIAPIFDPEGSIEKFVAIQRDISKKTELDRLKTEFLLTASHELRTPLTNIIGYAELLLNRDFSSTESKTFLKYIHDQSKHLSNLVSDLLDVSRMEAGTALVVSPKLVRPAPLFRKIVEHWQEMTANHDIRLIQPDNWPELNADEDRLRQVLNNLLSNAVKYSPDGGDVKVQVRAELGSLQVVIEDQGIGMTIDEQQHLFEKFWRADASAVAIEGTGLGMVIVKHIIEAHGGKIWVTSRKGVGTSVNFSLPLTDAAPTILVIEDDPSILEVEERLLSLEGYRVITAEEGLLGLDAAVSEHPDLIVLDLMLPEVEGEDILRKLKTTPATSNIPVVVVSARSAMANIEYAFTLGAADFLTKPFDLDEFLGRIRITLLNKQV